MKVSINKKSLLSSLNVVSRALPQKSTVPIFFNLLFDIEGENCNIYARNGELQIKGLVSCEAKESFKMCIPGTRFINTIKLLSEDVINMNYNPSKFTCTISAGKKRYKLTGFNPKDFSIRTLSSNDGMSFDTQSKQIIGHIKTLSNIVSWEDMRPQLSGITIINNNGTIELSGIHSGHYFYRGITNINTDKNIGIVVNKSLSTTMANMDGKGDTNMIIGKRNVGIKMDGFELVSTLIDVNNPIIIEKYFDYKDDKYIIVDREEIMMSLRRLQNYSDVDQGLRIEVKAGELILNSEDQNFGVDAEEILDIDNKGFSDKVFGLNMKYLLSILGNIDGDKVQIHESNGNIRMICIQDHTIEANSILWGCAEYSLTQKV